MTAYQRPRFSLRFSESQKRSPIGDRVSQSAACIQMLSHQLSKPSETLPCPQKFHNTLLARAIFHSHFTFYTIFTLQKSRFICDGEHFVKPDEPIGLMMFKN